MALGGKCCRRRGERGASAVEFALVLPILAILMLGIIQFGWYFFVANNASSAAREAARRVVVGDCWSGEFQPFVTGQAPTTTSASYSPTNLNDTGVKIGDPVTITVTADGVLLSFIPWGASGGQVTREFTARLEDKTAGTCS